MKKNLLIGLFMLVVSAAFAQSIDNSFFDKVNYRGAFGTSDWTAGWANFNPQVTVYAATTQTIAAGNITANTTWTKNNVYLLNGWVYVKDGATLTIEAGTVIRGDKTNKGALIVEKGGKLIANGTVTEPIVFTSNQAAGSRTYGDWGGIIICGKAPINVTGGSATIEGGVGATYGGTDAADNSGSLQYVRIEFPGIAFATNNEINGLTMGGVGSATTLDNIQVSYSGDDSFEWFGGTVNAKHLIALRGTDDDFDTDYGYSGMVQFGLTQRDPNVADAAGKSNCFESDNDGSGSTNTPFTTAIFSNVSSFGPKATTSSTCSSFYQAGINVKKNTKLQVYNSLLAGWVNGVKVEAENTKTNMVNNDIKVRNTVISGIATGSEFIMSSVTSWTAADMLTWYNTTSFKNTINADNATLSVTDPFNQTAPKFNLSAVSSMNTGSYWYQENNTATIDNNFFDKVNYRGAFGTSDWTAGWANFNPQVTVYAATTQTIAAGNITANTTWTKNNVYLLNGWVYVKDGATLTIEAGTVIRGDKTNKGALIVEKGGKLIANGTVTEPIVFTSNQAAGSRTYGDWGGIIICGKAPINVTGGSATIEGGVGATYGGTDAADNSGSLQYVRIEFPGIAFATNNEINGLTMGGVGSATTLDNIQVSYSGDDSFEWFGGTVNAKHLIALRGTDDDFDTDYGYSGMVQFGLTQRDPNVADAAGKSNCFESDNDGSGSTNTPFTTAIFSNVSSFGPKATTSSTCSSFYQAGINVKKNTKLQVYNSLLAGWVNGVKVEAENTKTNMVNNDIKVRNTVISGIATGSEFIMSSVTSWTAADMLTWYNTTSFKNTINADNATLSVTDPFNQTAPKFNLSAVSSMNTGSYWNAPTSIFTPKSAFANSLKVYPNPATSQVIVELPEFSGFTTIQVTDIAGRNLINKTVSNVEKEVLNISELRKGMYMIVARQGNTTYNQKLTVR